MQFVEGIELGSWFAAGAPRRRRRVRDPRPAGTGERFTIRPSSRDHDVKCGRSARLALLWTRHRELWEGDQAALTDLAISGTPHTEPEKPRGARSEGDIYAMGVSS